MVRLFQYIDIVIMPLMAATIPDSATFEDLEPSLELFANVLTLSAPAPMTGCPALQLPCGFDSRGLPLGFQVMAAPLNEALLFRIGAAWESASDWHTRRLPKATGSAEP